jgi:hypothetical protein
MRAQLARQPLEIGARAGDVVLVEPSIRGVETRHVRERIVRRGELRRGRTEVWLRLGRLPAAVGDAAAAVGDPRVRERVAVRGDGVVQQRLAGDRHKRVADGA